tara:strand:- start:125 stop:469 length:345 start_codon:yes stop_codon:yes gene_type:complete
MENRFIIFQEEPPVELQLSTEMRCREIQKLEDIEYLKKYCVGLVRNNTKRDAILAATLQELAEAHVIIAKQEKEQIFHWWVLKRILKDLIISIALFFVIRLNTLLTFIRNKTVE